MSGLEVALLAIAGFFTSALTAVVGAGGGTVLLALMLQFMPPATAIPVHGVVQLASNTSRTWLFRQHLAWPLISRFALLLPFGVILGLWLFQHMPKELVQVLIGCFVIFTLFLRRLRRFAPSDFPLWAFVPLGFVTGALNMIVGVIGPVLGALVIRKELSKEAIVGTLGVFGVLGNLLKIAGFVYAGFSLAEYGPALLVMIPAAMLGAAAGRRVLTNVSEMLFLRVFQLMLLCLAAKLILYDGLMWLWPS